MSDWTGDVILGCWGVWLVCWLLMAVSTKHTSDREGHVSRLQHEVVMRAALAGLIISVALSHHATNMRLWHTTVALGVVTILIVLAGAAFSVWARITLGRNWSSNVTFKQDHKLIESGPYSLARHPIYTGMIAMGLGTAINSGLIIGIVSFFLLCFGFWLKASREEVMMLKHFPEEYAEYKERVHALIPFIW